MADTKKPTVARNRGNAATVKRTSKPAERELADTSPTIETPQWNDTDTTPVHDQSQTANKNQG